jgi:hypothetical protein
MKNLFTKFLVVLAIVFTMLQSCSKSDDNITVVGGGDAFKMQIVTIELPNTILTTDEYHGTISNVSVTLRKSDEHKLLVMIPSTAELGNQDLVINDLNNLKVTYNVKDIVLSTTPDATIAEMQTNLSTFQQTMVSTNPQFTSTQQAISNFNDVYSNATEENKIKLASLYLANKALFDNIILNDFSSITGKVNLNTALVFLQKHKLAVISMIVGVLLITNIVATPTERVIGIALLGVGFYKAKGFGQQFATEAVNTMQLEIDNTLGTNNKNANATNNTIVSLTNNIATAVPFNTINRTVITSDSNKTEAGMALFFKYFNILNGYVAQVNPVIQWVNANVPFANFNLLTPETVPTSSATVNTPMDAASFQKLTLSITDPAVTLQNATLTTSGQLSIKVKIVGNSTTPIQSILKYSYADDYSTFSGSFPITVSNSPVATNLITNGDFSSGNTNFITNYIYCNSSNCLFNLANNGYAIANNASTRHNSFVGIDHTNGNGQFMIVNGSISTYIVWKQTVNVTINKNYDFEAWICTLFSQSTSNIIVKINGIQLGTNFSAPSSVNQWIKLARTWNSGNNTVANIEIFSTQNISTGNDFGLDDISFKQL